jgi:hypothetical protein
VSEPVGARPAAVDEPATERASDRLIVVALSVLAVALVAVAAAVQSYVPLFFVWAPQIAVLAWISRGGLKPSEGGPDLEAPVEEEKKGPDPDG